MAKPSKQQIYRALVITLETLQWADRSGGKIYEYTCVGLISEDSSAMQIVKGMGDGGVDLAQLRQSLENSVSEYELEGA